MNVVPLRAPDPEIVRKLEDLLELAKDGRITAFAAAVTQIEAGTGSVYELGEHGDIAHLVCALERAKKRLLEIE